MVVVQCLVIKEVRSMSELLGSANKCLRRISESFQSGCIEVKMACSWYAAQQIRHPFAHHLLVDPLLPYKQRLYHM